MQKKVLIVDDESLVADTLGIIFRKNGFNCITAYTGDQAVALAETFLPELLICDVCMPGLDGFTVSTAVSNLVPDCRILMFTGHYVNLHRIQSHIDDLPSHSIVVTKPVQPQELLLQARHLLAQPDLKPAALPN